MPSWLARAPSGHTRVCDFVFPHPRLVTLARTRTDIRFKRTATVKTEGEVPELPDMSWFDAYHEFEQHLQFLEDVQAAFPNNSEVFVAGESLEGRPISGIHLWGRDGPGAHEAIVWHGTVHAREWVVAPVSFAEGR